MNDTPRPYGLGRIFKRRGNKEEWPTSSAAWWVEFWNNGRQHRESAGTTSRSKATALLKQRNAEITDGRFVANETKLAFDALKEMLVNDYKINGKRSLSTVLYYLETLTKFFGLDRAVALTPDRVRTYQVHRQNEGAANATINREVSALRRMLTLAFEAGKLARLPRFKMLAENNVRQGFLAHGDFLTLLSNLPVYM